MPTLPKKDNALVNILSLILDASYTYWRYLQGGRRACQRISQFMGGPVGFVYRFPLDAAATKRNLAHPTYAWAAASAVTSRSHHRAARRATSMLTRPQCAEHLRRHPLMASRSTALFVINIEHHLED